MNVRSLVALSVLMNVALVVVGWRTGRSPVSATGMTAEPSAPSGVLRVKTSLTRVELTETNEAAPFHWREVQAEDLKEFVANLRGLGCPPETVRAIIESELWRRFLPLRRTLLEPFHRQFWELAAAIPNSEKAWEPIKQSMLALKAETLGKLDEIVGLEPAKRSRNQHLDFLSEEKQRALEELEKRVNGEIGRLPRGRGGKILPEMHAKRDELQGQRKAAIRALITPEEYAEHELRHSRHASIAQNVMGFDATPEEMRMITRTYEQFETADAPPDREEPDAGASKAQAAEARKQREEALKEALSPGRYAQFQEGQDGSFQEIYRITQRYELPRETASAAAGVVKTAGEALRRLREDKARDNEELMQRELAVQVETRQMLLVVLGERALRTYEKYQGPVVQVPENDAAR